MKVSIIVINYKTKESTLACAESVYKNFKPGSFELIIVDNHSNDGSVEFLGEKLGEKALLIANSENVGFGRGNNIGARRAGGELLFFLNSDTLLTSGILYGLSELFNDERVGICGPRLYLPDGSPQEYAYGRFPTLVSTLFPIKKGSDKTNSILEVDWISGAALMIRRRLFKELGGFDENFFMYFEDVDLCLRAREKGYINILLPSLSLVHSGGKSAGNFSRKKMYYSSQSYYFKKHFGVTAMLLLGFFRWPYKIFTAILSRTKKFSC